jgi:D-alanine-D-alanine ligase
MDKTLLHAVLEGYYGIKMARWRMLRREKLEHIDNFCNETAEFLGFPICVKPACGGSRTGVNTAENIDELKSALKTAFSHDDKAIAEEYIGGRRLEIAVMGNSAADTFTTAVTESTVGNELVPVESSLSVMVKDTALKAYKALGCKGFARIGFFYNDSGLYLNRINTIPVFGGESIYPKLMADAGILETELIDRLIKLCLEMHGEI